MGVSENRGSEYSTKKIVRRVLIIRTPKLRYPEFRKLPNREPFFFYEVIPTGATRRDDFHLDAALLPFKEGPTWFRKASIRVSEGFLQSAR